MASHDTVLPLKVALSDIGPNIPPSELGLLQAPDIEVYAKLLQDYLQPALAIRLHGELGIVAGLTVFKRAVTTDRAWANIGALIPVQIPGPGRRAREAKVRANVSPGGAEFPSLFQH